jgi:two-component system, cell cycle sensor histidine kinase and response regulator CckA
MNSPRILVVEDEAIVAMDIRRRLDLLGYQVAGSASTGEAAVALTESQRPALVLMDIRLQGAMDGVAAAIEIRRRCKVPVVFLTAYAEDGTLQQAKLAEPFGYVLKPFEDRELKTIIEMALYKHQAELEIRHLNRLYAVLSQTNQFIVRAGSRDELFSAICQIAVEHGEFRGASVSLLELDTRAFRVVTERGDDTGVLGRLLHSVEEPEGVAIGAGRATREGRTWVSKDLAAPAPPTDTVQTSTGQGIRAAAVVPIRFQGAVCGALGVGAAEPDFFHAKEIELLEEVALDISFALDIFEREAQRRQAETALVERDALWRAVFGNAPCGIAVYRLPDGPYLDVNPAFERQTGLRAADIIGKRPSEILRIGPDDQFQRANRELLKTGPVEDVELVIAKPDGSLSQILYSAAAFAMGGSHCCVSLTVEITERKRAEEERHALQTQLIQAQKMEAIGQLAGGVAHDFNNILTAVLLHLKLLEEDPQLSDGVRSGLKELDAEAKRAISLTRQLLVFSRRQVLQTHTFDLNPLLANLLKMLQRLIGEQITVDLRGAPGELWLTADKGMLEQVVMNLMVNARDAMPNGGRVTLTTQRIDFDEAACAHNAGAYPGPFACLTVSDTGSGMDEATLQRIFEPFFTTKEPGKGTGLGLATVYGIVKQHKGWVEVESTPGRGTTFRVYLPASPTALVKEVAAVEVQAAPRGTETILVVEDAESLRRVIVSMLRRLGYRVVEAANSQDALALWPQEQANVALLLTDMVMPGALNGQELGRRLQADKPSLKCVVVSGYSRDLVQEGLVPQRETTFLAKPFSLTDLAEKVRACLDGK